MDYFPPRSCSDAENEADKMSLDAASSSSCSSSECADADADGVPDEEPGDVTDEEDWASIGAAALRLGSASGGKSGCLPLRQGLGAVRRLPGEGGGGGPAREALAMSMPGFGCRLQAAPAPSPPHARLQGWSGFADLMQVGSDSQEREAIEALVRLSSI